MGKVGNPYHEAAGTSKGGQFASKGIVVRPTPMENDIQSYLNSPMVGNPDPLYKRERIRNVNKAFYDGGYLIKRGSELEGFETPDEAEAFIRKITSEHDTAEAWRPHRDMVENYVEVAKGYLSNDKFDLVIDGRYSKDGSYRDATSLMREFGLSRKDVKHLSADDFTNSGANNSKYEPNKGTVVMLFSPRVNIYGEDVELYVKLVLNPHPDRSRKQTEMQVLSFKEVEGTKTCLFTGEKRCKR